MIRAGRADVVICGGTESCIHPLQMASFGAMRAMSTRNDAPERASRPYDKNRDGFVLGEGAAVLILESEEHARARGAHIHGIAVAGKLLRRRLRHRAARPERRGAGQGDAARPQGRRAGTVRHRAHQRARHLDPGRHDVAELASIKAGLGEDAARQVVVTATKSMTGTCSAAPGRWSRSSPSSR